MTHDEAMDLLASLLTPDFTAALDDSEAALLHFCEHGRLEKTCHACRDAPAPFGVRRTPGTIYGCGNRSCVNCYEPDDRGALSYRRDHIPVPTVLFPPQIVYWRIYPHGEGVYQVHPVSDLQEAYVLLVMQNGRILFPCTSPLCLIQEGQRFDVCIYSRAEDGLPGTLVSCATLMFYRGDCYHAAFQHFRAPFPFLNVLALPMNVE
jgi:hypothetical protein